MGLLPTVTDGYEDDALSSPRLLTLRAWLELLRSSGGPETEQQDATVPALTVPITTAVHPPGVRVASEYAEKWYRDARAEAAVEGTDARRREIVFAVCCAEAYLFEWAYSEPFGGDIAAIPRYFPKDDKRGLSERWKKVLKDLFEAEVIPARPDFDGAHGVHWNQLVRQRDGFIHAVGSLSGTDPQPDTDTGAGARGPGRAGRPDGPQTWWRNGFACCMRQLAVISPAGSLADPASGGWTSSWGPGRWAAPADRSK